MTICTQRSAARSLGLVFATLMLAAPALAQPRQTPPAPPSGSQSNSGLGPQTTNPGQVDPGQNMILPSAGSSGPSAAPTMVFDCAKKPSDCTPPATQADKGTAPPVSGEAAVPPVKN